MNKLGKCLGLEPKLHISGCEVLGIQSFSSPWGLMIVGGKSQLGLARRGKYMGSNGILVLLGKHILKGGGYRERLLTNIEYL